MNDNTKKLLDMTLKDLQRRKEARERGQNEARNFSIENAARRNRQALNSKKRGNRSFG